VEAHRVVRRRDSHIFLDNRLIDGVEVVSLKRRPHLLPPGRFLVLISVTGWVDPRAIVRLEGLGQPKTPVTSPGIESATFRLVVKCLNQLRYRVPPGNTVSYFTLTRTAREDFFFFLIFRIRVSIRPTNRIVWIKIWHEKNTFIAINRIVTSEIIFYSRCIRCLLRVWSSS
jgi:hypothetical protein